MTFNEANAVEAFIRDLLCGGVTDHTSVGPGLARHNNQLSGLGWHYLSHHELPRQPQEALVEDHLREALIRLNPTIATNPDRADDVIYQLRAIIMGVRSDGLVKANEAFVDWLTGEKSMPFGESGEHVTIELEAPGLEKDEIDVSVDERQVTITGQKRVESERREGSMVIRERAFGRFQRTIPTPVAVTAEGAEASYRRGVLRIRVPKLASPGGRSITIQKG